MSDEFEAHIRTIAQSLSYPTASRPHRTVRRHTTMRPLRYAALILVAFAISTLSIPGIRAAVLDFLRIGAVTIYLDGRGAEGELLNLDDVSGETSLDIARTQVDFVLRIPPDDPPNRVFVQDDDLVILVWLAADAIETALYQTDNDQWHVVKTAETLLETQVGEEAAYWVSLQQPVQFINEGIVRSELTHFVAGNVLGWEQNGVTYRLETNLPLDEARTLAESLMPLP